MKSSFRTDYWAAGLSALCILISLFFLLFFFEYNPALNSRPRAQSDSGATLWVELKNGKLWIEGRPQLELQKGAFLTLDLNQSHRPRLLQKALAEVKLANTSGSKLTLILGSEMTIPYRTIEQVLLAASSEGFTQVQIAPATEVPTK